MGKLGVFLIILALLAGALAVYGFIAYKPPEEISKDEATRMEVSQISDLKLEEVQTGLEDFAVKHRVALPFIAAFLFIVGMACVISHKKHS